ncbi:MAG TPA: hypothetical protein VLK03_13460 [Nocardioides sp.]|nr:hypothetical protein [Nocardioides sp.]
MSTTPHRPQVLWLPMGGLLGALAGAVTGVVMLLAAGLFVVATDGTTGTLLADAVFLVLVGSFLGGMAGAVVGLCVGLELMVLVGTHLSREAARRRAHRLGFVLPPLTLVGPAGLLGGGDLSVSDGGAWWVLGVLAGASLLGGPLARRLADFQRPRPATPGPAC